MITPAAGDPGLKHSPKRPGTPARQFTLGRFPIVTTRKSRLHRLIIERLAQDLSVLSNAAKTAHEAAIHEENVPDNKYDTLSLEASYVAQGQANRAQELKRALQAYQRLTLHPFGEGDSIRLTALVTLEDEEGTAKTFFIGPQEGGLKLQPDGEEILVITAASPLGSELIGKSLGDEVELGSSCYEIVDVC
ncbi:GreA/GreB family elongation factor [Geomonas nitrogeniifigens]|uniref:GreA/GreB family elongation factor n=1 Tax=Geomonas diazotrophica TaxID=2843197 RepID=A0ABX8JGU1_9BACT|nr:GreA/GreB family elongation factor [Geomonas nitrogeniifigens]